MDNRHDETDFTCADTVKVIEEQHDDPSLAKYFQMIKNDNNQFIIHDGILCPVGKVQGNKVELLCLPERCVQTMLGVSSRFSGSRSSSG